MPSDATGVQLAVLVVVLVLAVLLLRATRVQTRRAGRSSAVLSVPDGQDPPFAALVLNPAKTGDPAALHHWVADVSAGLGWGDPLVLETTRQDYGHGQTRQALAEGAAAVLVYGGDGTIRAVAAELAGTGVPLGLLPAGTGNLLARNLGLGAAISDRDVALRTALAGRDRPIDVGRAFLQDVDADAGDDALGAVREEAFMVMAGLGFDAEVMASVEPRLKRRVGWLAYVVAGAKRLRGRSTKVRITLDGGEPFERRVRSVVVGNCGELTGGVRLLPHAVVDDGLLDVVIVAPRGLAGWAPVLASIITRWWGHPAVQHFSCRCVEVVASGPMESQLDGDPAGPVRVLRAQVQHGGLVVRVPSL